jgi:transposase
VPGAATPGLATQKKSLHTSERDTPRVQQARQEYCAKIAALDLGRLKAVGVQQALARRGARLLYVPPYSPDLSLIEPCWLKVKTGLRQAKARTRDALDTAIADVMVTVSLADAWGWFKHCGYSLQ